MAATYNRRSNTNTNRTRTQNWTKTNWTKTNSGNRTGTHSTSYSNYSNLRCNFQQKINGYRTLYNQTQGTGGTNRPSPTTLNTFASWINKGAVIHKVSPTQICRWSKTNQKFTSVNAVKTALCNKFGKTPIKAVCKSKGGSYLVATVPTYHGKNFRFPR
jgi:hypothetical protein